MQRTFALTIAYDGTDFFGWQVQPDLPTIQGTIEKAIRKSTGQSVTVTGSGRTDAGVHALGQVASCRFESWTASTDALLKAINSRLPDSIVIREVEEADANFHAIRDALGKRYRYQLQVRGQRNPFQVCPTWACQIRLDPRVRRLWINTRPHQHGLFAIDPA
ncbi:MAG: hypothetical protein AAGJ83_11430 [Planctomycetota bacterium]